MAARDAFGKLPQVFGEDAAGELACAIRFDASSPAAFMDGKLQVDGDLLLAPCTPALLDRDELV